MPSEILAPNPGEQDRAAQRRASAEIDRGLPNGRTEARHQRHPIVVASAALAALDPAPITPDWIVSGNPEARAKLLAKSEDKTSSVVVWDCTPGRFNWHYTEDESVCILSGEVFITTADGVERRLGQGDVAFFPAGSSCTWRVTEQVRKVAFLRKDMPLLLGLAVRAWHRFLRASGARGQMPL